MSKLTPSQIASRGYAERTRAGFLVLLYLIEHDAIKEDALPEGVLKSLKSMVMPWVNMKLKRSNQFTKIVTQPEASLVFRLNENRDKEHTELLNEAINNCDSLIKNGYLYIIPNEELSSFFPKLTITGEILADVLNDA